MAQIVSSACARVPSVPSVGKSLEMDEIRRVIKRLESDLEVRVNTIMMGASGRAFDFMEKLADENDGESKGK